MLVRLVYAVGYALARLASIAILTVFVMVAEVQELATVALARRAAGLPDQGELAEARFLDPEADLVAEAPGIHQFQGT